MADKNVKKEDSADQKAVKSHSYNLRDRDVLKQKLLERSAAIYLVPVLTTTKRLRGKSDPPASKKRRLTPSKDFGDDESESGGDSDDDAEYEEEEDENTYWEGDEDADLMVAQDDYEYDDGNETEDEYEEEKAKELSNYAVTERVSTASFKDLGGFDKIKDELVSTVIGPFACPDKAKVLSLSPPRGILLTGRPGTGKTVLADAIVSRINDLMGENVSYYVESGQCLSEFFGESEKRIRHLFETAKKNKPSVIFLDEIDGIGRKRGEASCRTGDTLITTLLTEISQIVHGEVLVIAATNLEERIDPALKRKGRFDFTFKLPLPNKEGRRQILDIYFEKLDQEICNEDVDELIRRTENYTGADLEALVKDIQRNVIKRIFPNHEWLTTPIAALKERLTISAKMIRMESDVEPLLEPENQENPVDDNQDTLKLESEE